MKKYKIFAFLLLTSNLLIACTPLTSSEISNKTSTEVRNKELTILTKLENSLLYGEELQIEVSEDSYQIDELDFTSSNPSIASISSTGLIKANDVEGGVIISISVKKDSSIKKTIYVNVKKRVRVSQIISTSNDIYLAKDGGEISFKYTVLPSNATNKEVDIYIEDPSIAKLDASLSKVTALKSGQTKLVIKSKESFSNVKLEIPVTVNKEGFVSLNVEEDNNPNQYLTLKGANDSIKREILPSLGKQNVLVIPLEFTDYSFDRYYKQDEKLKSDLNKVFNLTKEDTKYYESVSSYFKKSSFNKLDLAFDIADKYVSKMKASEVSVSYPTDQAKKNFETVLNAAIDDYKSKNDISKYDKDKDGGIDSVWFIYSIIPSDGQNSVFGTYTYYSQNYSEDISSPILSTYAVCSIEELFDHGVDKLDSHTLIHETGHLLGLNDYYNYSSLFPTAPLGMLDMQDLNVGDHNVYSKMSLGWLTPIIYDTSINQAGKVHLDPSYLNGSSLLITNKYHKTFFDEYLLLELYTPNGLNELDSTYNYYEETNKYYEDNNIDTYIEKLPTTIGVKMYHVDSRLITKGYTSSSKQEYYPLDEIQNIKNDKLDKEVTIGASNTNSYSRNYTYELFNQISLVSNKITGGTYLNSFSSYTEDDLFKTGSSFDLETYKVNTYNNSSLLNNGEKLNVKIKFTSVNENGADLIIENLH